MGDQNNNANQAQIDHQERLVSLVHDARELLAFAAANAKSVGSDIRNPLIGSANAIAAGTQSLDDEQTFFKAYEALTIKTAPVTADTLETSKTVLPDIGAIFSRRWRSEWKKLTLGRFLNAGIFLVVLLITGVSLGYNAVGADALQRYRALTENEKNTPADKKEALDRIHGEQNMLVERLWQWSQQPCQKQADWLFKWTLCSAIDDRTGSAESVSPGYKIEAAKAVSARLSGVYLPLLLGWLGAQAFILRRMTKEIAENAFAPSSALHHIARIGLGALAGFASVWLLTPETVGGEALKAIPPWALAFIAGYGIELVFSFMDRIISAFATRTT